MIGVAVDASVLINFLIVAKVGLLASLPGLRFVVPEEVVAEIRRPEQVQALARALEAGSVCTLDAMSPRELETLTRLNTTLGSGEAACLAVAESRNWFVACDEKRAFLRQATRLLGEGRLLDTPTLLMLGIREGLISVREADLVKAELEKASFTMSFDSFRDLPEVRQWLSLQGRLR